MTLTKEEEVIEMSVLKDNKENGDGIGEFCALEWENNPQNLWRL